MSGPRLNLGGAVTVSDEPLYDVWVIRTGSRDWERWAVDLTRDQAVARCGDLHDIKGLTASYAQALQ